MGFRRVSFENLISFFTFKVNVVKADWGKDSRKELEVWLITIYPQYRLEEGGRVQDVPSCL